MTMLRKCLAAVGALAALAWVGAARADEPTSGAASVDAPTITLQGDGQANTELVKGFHGGGFHGGGFHGGFHGHHGGFHGHYHAGFYGHHHGGWGGGYYAGYYRPWSYGYGYASYYPSYYSSYYYPSYYYPNYCYSPYSYSYYPAAYSYVGYTPATVAVTYAMNGTAANTVPTVPLNQQQYYMPPATSGPATNGSASFPGPGGTPIYDGGPAHPVPLPQDVPAPQNGAAAPQAPKGYPVSITGPVQNSGYTFPAFGETSTAPAPKTATPAGGFAFPAYGEQSKNSNFATGGN